MSKDSIFDNVTVISTTCYLLKLFEVFVLKKNKNGVTVVGEYVKDEELMKDKDDFLRIQARLLQQLI